MDSNGRDFDAKIPKLPNIEEITTDMPAISEYCSASRLPELFKTANTDTLPVINMSGQIIGIVSEYDLAKVLPDWSFEVDSYTHEYKVADIMTKDVWTETEDTNIENLLSKVNRMHTRVIPVVDKSGFYTGNTIKRSSIVNYLTKFVKPRSLGGLATPLGVYITDGAHQAGAGNFGLFLTGVTLGAIIVAIEFLLNLGLLVLGIDSITDQLIPLIIGIEILTFIGILRLTPLVKIHAAEHQTINAIEKGMPLSVETVKMQPREHVRCGTNLMVLIIGIQVVIITYAAYFIDFDPLLQFLFLVTGFSLVFSYWRQFGMIIQKYFTTAKAGDNYILSGIKAGNEILRKHKEDPSASSPSVFTKIWNAGIIQIIAGFLFVQKIFDSIMGLF